MSDIENSWIATGSLNHLVKTEHVNYQIIIAKLATTLAKDDFVITGFQDFSGDVLDL
ncbi:hypothetical protein D3C78_1934910 [compost metagenome]